MQLFLKKVKEGNFKLKAKQYLQVSTLVTPQEPIFHELGQSEEFDISYKKQSAVEPLENSGQAEKDFASLTTSGVWATVLGTSVAMITTALAL